jgi:Flp pilus assembly pilin Flp
MTIQHNVIHHGGNNTMDFINTQYARILNALETEDGQGFAEYALIFALVVIVAAATLGPLGTTIAAQFTAVVGAF